MGWTGMKDLVHEDAAQEVQVSGRGRLDGVLSLLSVPFLLMAPFSVGAPGSKVRCIQRPQHTKAVLQMSPHHDSHRYDARMQPFLLSTQ